MAFVQASATDFFRADAGLRQLVESDHRKMSAEAPEPLVGRREIQVDFVVALDWGSGVFDFGAEVHGDSDLTVVADRLDDQANFFVVEVVEVAGP